MHCLNFPGPAHTHAISQSRPEMPLTDTPACCLNRGCPGRTPATLQQRLWKSSTHALTCPHCHADVQLAVVQVHHLPPEMPLTDTPACCLNRVGPGHTPATLQQRLWKSSTHALTCPHCHADVQLAVVQVHHLSWSHAQPSGSSRAASQWVASERMRLSGSS
jgi:glutaredoxin